MTEERMFEIATAFAAFIDEHVSEADVRGPDHPAKGFVIACGPEAIVTGFLKRIPDTNIAEIVEALGDTVKFYRHTAALLQSARNSLLATKGRGVVRLWRLRS